MSFATVTVCGLNEELSTPMPRGTSRFTTMMRIAKALGITAEEVGRHGYPEAYPRARAGTTTGGVPPDLAQKVASQNRAGWRSTARTDLLEAREVTGSEFRKISGRK